MTDLREEALARLRQRPAADQNLAAEIVMSLLNRDVPEYCLTPEQEDDVARIQDDLKAGRTRLMTDDEVEAMWRRLGIEAPIGARRRAPTRPNRAPYPEREPAGRS